MEGLVNRNGYPVDEEGRAAAAEGSEEGVEEIEVRCWGGAVILARHREEFDQAYDIMGYVMQRNVDYTEDS